LRKRKTQLFDFIQTDHRVFSHRGQLHSELPFFYSPAFHVAHEPESFHIAQFVGGFLRAPRGQHFGRRGQTPQFFGGKETFAHTPCLLCIAFEVDAHPMSAGREGHCDQVRRVRDADFCRYFRSRRKKEGTAGGVIGYFRRCPDVSVHQTAGRQPFAATFLGTDARKPLGIGRHIGQGTQQRPHFFGRLVESPKRNVDVVQN